MVFSIIQKSQLEGAKRLDAEYYQPEFLLLKKQLLEYGNLLPLLKIAVIKTGPAYSSEAIDEEFEIPVARIGDITNKKDVEDWQKLSTKEFEKFKNNAVNDDDILMTMTGDPPDVGKVNLIINKEKRILAFNQRTAKIKATQVDSKYLFAYLNTEFSRFQAERTALGIRQRNLGIDDLKNILVAIPKKEYSEKINKIIDSYFYNLQNSKFLYQQAERLLLSELRLENFNSDENLSSIVNFSEMQSVNRIDAEYFQGKYLKLEEKIREYEYKSLESIIYNVPAKFDASKKSQEIFKYVELSNINMSIGTIDGASETLGKEAPSRAKRILKENDVIVSSVEGSLGKVALVMKDQEDFLASTGFFQFRSDKILPEVLLVLAKSIVFQLQLEKRCSGTVLTAVPKESIKNIIIPVLPKPIQEKISKLVRESFESRKKAKELLEEAKRNVEQLIEQGEK